MSGVDLQGHLIREGKRMPMIFITTVPDEVSRARALGAGAACFLTKPFDGNTLIDCVHAALKAAGSSRAPEQEPRDGPHPSAKDVDVRVTIEQTRQALVASAAEIERSKRLLRETEELGNLPVPPPANFNDGEPS